VLFILHNEYAKAAAPRPDAHVWARVRGGHAKAPPGALRAGTARGLASAASRLDRESARRVLA
jgi:hypothetical protein